MAGTYDLVDCDTVARDRNHPSANADCHEVRTLSMSLPAVAGVHPLAAPSASPIATVPAVRTADGLPVRLVLVTAELDPVLLRRIRVECAELEAILSGVDAGTVLPVLDHGVDEAGRPYLLVPRPGPELGEVLATDGPLPLPVVLMAARAVADGLAALAARGILGPPRGLCRDSAGQVTLGPPLPPVLAELEATLGAGTGHEPPEVLGGEDWTTAGETFACACLLWTLLSGRPPFGSEPSLARLLVAEPPRMRRPDIPEPMAEVLRTALAARPADRPATPAALADALSKAALPSAEARPLGSRYLLENQIGQGAQGQVWTARRRSGGDLVAVKVLRAALIEDEQATARFVREFRLLRSLRHPHLIRVHDFLMEDGELAIVMDLVYGEDLRRYARRRRLSATQAASLLAQTASGLAAVHAAGIVHRDVKPTNVLVSDREGGPVALLTDFGIARAVEGAAHTQMIGTPAYVAPELVAGRPPSAASDVYALGITAYELFAGRTPFPSESRDALNLAHLDQAPARPDGMADDVWGLVVACLAKSPDARPSAAEAAARWGSLAGSGLVSALVSAVAPQDPPGDGLVTVTSSRPVPVRPQEPRPRGRRRLVLVAIAVALVGLAGGICLALRDRPPTPPQQPSSQQSSSQQSSSQYAVTPVVVMDRATVATLSWSSQPSRLPGFQGYVVLDVNGDHARPLSTPLPTDITSYQVSGLRPGRTACYLVVALGVTTRQPDPPPQPACVTPPSPTPTPSR
jgi:serine/threonine protein kinase